MKRMNLSTQVTVDELIDLFTTMDEIGCDLYEIEYGAGKVHCTVFPDGIEDISIFGEAFSPRKYAVVQKVFVDEWKTKILITFTDNIDSVLHTSAN